MGYWLGILLLIHPSLLVLSLNDYTSALEFLNLYFRFVTASEAVSSDSNSKLNVDKLIGYRPIETLAHYGGNVTDNANSAIDESRKNAMESLACRR
jgi:hypothetical protein